MLNARLLVVEDNPGDVLLLKTALKRAGVQAELTIAINGDDALASLRTQPRLPHLILLDLNLPDRDGREILEEIRSDPALAKIPVVVLSSSDAEEDILSVYSKHANSYLTKPESLEALTNAVTTLSNYWFDTVELPVPRDGS